MFPTTIINILFRDVDGSRRKTALASCRLLLVARKVLTYGNPIGRHDHYNIVHLQQPGCFMQQTSPSANGSLIHSRPPPVVDDRGENAVSPPQKVMVSWEKGGRIRLREKNSEVGSEQRWQQSDYGKATPLRDGKEIMAWKKRWSDWLINDGWSWSDWWMNVAGWTEEATTMMDDVPRRRVNSNTEADQMELVSVC
eukprot:scaffold2592_cov145-Skeletonema_menzelii.AAC.6